MATNFPTSLQDLDATRGTSGDSLSSPNHITHHLTEDDTIEALQTKVGIDDSTDTTSIDYLLKNTSSIDPGHKHTAANITDFDTEVANNSEVSLNTSHRSNTSNPHSTSISNLTDTSITTPSSGQGLVYNGTNWANQDIATQTELDTHTGDTSNPHSVTASQVGISSTDDVAEGTTNLYYTEARVSANTDVAANTSHRSNTSNPHSVTKIQVGLGNVEDLKVNLNASAAPTATDDSTAGYSVGSRWIDTTNDKEYVCLDATASAAVWTETTASAGSGSGDVTGPASSTDNAIVRFDGTTGKIIQNSGVTISDTNTISGVYSLSLSGYVDWGGDYISGGTGINFYDSFGNEYLKLTKSDTPVNEITIKNADTGAAPEIQATGDDTNIDVNIVPKGTGVLKENGTEVSKTGHTHTASNITDFDTEVSNNTDVAANTSARHTQNTDTGTSASEFYVDTGGDNVAVKSHIQSTSNPHSVTASQVGALANVVEDTTPQLGGDLDTNEHLITSKKHTYTGVVGTTTIDWTKGHKAVFTFGAGNETLAFTAPTTTAGYEVSLQLTIKQDATGGRTITWPTSVKWVGGTAPTLSTGANAVDIVSFLYDSDDNVYRGVASLNFS